MSNDTLINRYRPQKFEDVVGHKSIVASFRRALEDGTSRAFLFTGIRGVGKTSLVRIGAATVGSNAHNIIEIDGASQNGIDNMRSIMEGLSFRPMNRGGIKSLIVDECHRISGAAFDSMLKSIEEPPSWVYWFLCTTDVRKVPSTVRSRCTEYELKPLPPSVIFEFLEAVVEAEKWDTPADVIQLCARMAEGSLRQGLSKLGVCYGAKNRKEASDLIADTEASEVPDDPGFKLARALAAGKSWTVIQPIINEICTHNDDERNRQISAEGVRHTVRAYFTKVISGAKDEKAACAALRVLDNFSEPCGPSEGFTPIVIAVGRSIF